MRLVEKAQAFIDEFDSFVESVVEFHKNENARAILNSMDGMTAWVVIEDKRFSPATHHESFLPSPNMYGFMGLTTQVGDDHDTISNFIDALRAIKIKFEWRRQGSDNGAATYVVQFEVKNDIRNAI